MASTIYATSSPVDWNKPIVPDKAVLDKSGIDVSNFPEVIKPENFKNLKDAKLIYKGLLKEYNKNNYMEYLLEMLFRKKDMV